MKEWRFLMKNSTKLLFALFGLLMAVIGCSAMEQKTKWKQIIGCPEMEQKTEWKHDVKQQWADGNYRTVIIPFPQAKCCACEKNIHTLYSTYFGYDSTKSSLLMVGYPCHKSERRICNGTKIAYVYNPQTKIQTLEVWPAHTDVPHFTQDPYSFYQCDQDNIKLIKCVDTCPAIEIETIPLSTLKNTCAILTPQSLSLGSRKASNNTSTENALIIYETLQNDTTATLAIIGVQPFMLLCTLRELPYNRDEQGFAPNKMFINDEGTHIYYFDATKAELTLFQLLDKTPHIKKMRNTDAHFRFLKVYDDEK